MTTSRLLPTISPMPSTYHMLALLLLLAATRVAEAMPSFGSRIPNGERVPCPPDADADSCLGGYCRGLGHGTCAGGVSGQSTPQILSPFGRDWKDLGGLEWTAELCQADSDGDGYTNGEELGDPCCLWVAGAIGGTGNSPYTASFSPTHPGNANHKPPEDYRRPSCDGADMVPPTPITDNGNDATADATGIAAFNPGERQGSFEFRIKDYPIPRTTTTYVDFVFNVPEDLDDIVHVVYGEAIIDQPKHLHHFVVTGCSSRVPEEIEGRPLEQVPDHCNLPVGGFSGWAPGVTMWGVPTNAGVPIGKEFGIQALSVNVHYTDGDDPYLEGKQAIAKDGIRVHYTPDLRPKTVTTSPVISVGFGPRQMHIEPNKKRAFMTRTCTVQSRCQDLSDSTISALGSRMSNDPELTCSSGAKKMYCAFSEQFKAACPASCGLCDDDSPRRMDEYNAIAVMYHAHIIGREMYTTLIPQDDPDARIDLSSRDVWTYEDQTAYDLKDIVLRPGDKIQTTCVYDSSEREELTRFDLATYDEMCLNTVTTIFDTPPIDEGGLSAANEIEIRGFRCDTSEAGDIWQGELGPDEDARQIIDLHPLKDNECSFPTGLWTFDAVPTQQMRCNGDIVKSDDGLCSDMEGSFLHVTKIAGHSCQGGLFNEKDSNDGTTEQQCTSGGGMWTAYNCGDADDYLQGNTGFAADATVRQYLKEYWWAPKCCIGGENDASEDSAAVGEEADLSTGNDVPLTTGSTSTGSSNAGAIAGGIIGAMAVVAIVSALISRKKRSTNMSKSGDIAVTRRETVFGDDLDNTRRV